VVAVSLDTTERVLALLDWELSTLGYPLADLAYSAMCYHFPSSDKTGVRGLPRPLPEGALLNVAHLVSCPLCACLPCVCLGNSKYVFWSKICCNVLASKIFCGTTHLSTACILRL